MASRSAAADPAGLKPQAAVGPHSCVPLLEERKRGSAVRRKGALRANATNAAFPSRNAPEEQTGPFAERTGLLTEQTGPLADEFWVLVGSTNHPQAEMNANGAPALLPVLSHVSTSLLAPASSDLWPLNS